ncbi:MAG: hypothetical protein FJ316_07840 [SAR202 cluster bacterium]|nr:hypothetical protein [SAR202 cluster bacterium]
MELVQQQKLQRYRGQSLRFLERANAEIGAGRWTRGEEMLWASLSLAIKGVALGRGQELADDQAVRAYAARLGQELRDQRVREAFTRLASVSDTLERFYESRTRLDYLLVMLEDVKSAIQRLWELALPDHDD